MYLVDLWLFQIIKIIPLLAVFGYAAYRDYRFGEVSNKVWLYTPIGLVLTLLELYLFTPTLAVFVLVPMVGVALFGFLLFFFSKGYFLGADSKAVVCLALCCPITPLFSGYVSVYPIVAFTLAAILSGLLFIARRGRGGFKAKVRFLPYLFVGMLLALI